MDAKLAPGESVSEVYPGSGAQVQAVTKRICYLILGIFAVVLTASFVIVDRIAPAGRRLAKVAGVDPPAYFGTAHSLLFDRDFDLSNEYQRVPPDDNPWTRVRPETGHPGSTYGVGYSLLAIPFLGAGTLADAMAGNPADGYSRFAMLGYCLTNVILTCIGLFALFSFLRGTAELWGVSDSRAPAYALFVTIAVFFGTNAGYYAFSQMSHASTFFAISVFLAIWWRVRNRTDVGGWALLGLAGGVLSICRWQEILYLGAPLLYDLANGGLSGIRLRLRSRIAYAAAGALCWVPQLIEWKYIYGKWFLVPQGSGVFSFPPHSIPEVMFSSRNGWFFWTPLALLGTVGLLFGAYRFARVFLPWMVVIAMEVVVIASLPTSWHGGQSFGSRYLTTTAPLIAWGLVSVLYAAPRVVRELTAAAAVACCGFTMLSAIQARLDLVPGNERLTPAEGFSDKLRLLQVRRRKAAVQRAEGLLASGSADAAVQTLEGAAAAYGEDRYVLGALSRAYRASGREADAENAEGRGNRLMASRLF